MAKDFDAMAGFFGMAALDNFIEKQGARVTELQGEIYDISHKPDGGELTKKEWQEVSASAKYLELVKLFERADKLHKALKESRSAGAGKIGATVKALNQRIREAVAEIDELNGKPEAGLFDENHKAAARDILDFCILAIDCML